MRCNQCEHCSLMVTHPSFELTVMLANFHRLRGSGPGQRPVDDLSMAARLVECLNLDKWPSPATILDFGIDSSSHLGVLQHAVDVGITAYDLDRVLGDGPAITALTRGVPGQPYRHVVFTTTYDDLFLNEEPD